MKVSILELTLIECHPNLIKPGTGVVALPQNIF